MTNQQTNQETKTVNDVTRLFKQIEANIALVETTRNALKSPDMEGTFDLDGEPAIFHAHIWTNTDNTRYGNAHVATKLVCYVYRKDKDSYKDLLVVNTVGVSEVVIEINDNFKKDCVYVTAKRTNTRDSVSDSAKTKVTAKLQPLINDLLTIWNSESAKANAVAYADLNQVLHALNQSRYEMNCVEARLRNKDIYFGLELAETLDKLTDVSGN